MSYPRPCISLCISSVLFNSQTLLFSSRCEGVSCRAKRYSLSTLTKHDVLHSTANDTQRWVKMTQAHIRMPCTTTRYIPGNRFHRYLSQHRYLGLRTASWIALAPQLHSRDSVEVLQVVFGVKRCVEMPSIRTWVTGSFMLLAARIWIEQKPIVK